MYLTTPVRIAPGRLSCSRFVKEKIELGRVKYLVTAFAEREIEFTLEDLAKTGLLSEPKLFFRCCEVVALRTASKGFLQHAKVCSRADQGAANKKVQLPLVRLPFFRRVVVIAEVKELALAEFPASLSEMAKLEQRLVCSG